MPLESIEALRVFTQVVDSGGLSAAGRVLGLSPPLVTRRIARLEADLGVRLLRRTTRSVSVTDEGAAFYRRCRRVLLELEAAEQEALPDPEQVRGRVRAILPTILACAPVMERIRELLDEQPGLSLQLSFSDQPVDLTAGGWDIAIHVGIPPDSSHVQRRLGVVHAQLAATPEYLAAHGIPQTPEDLSAHECLRWISDRPQDTWALVDPEGREVVVPVQGRFESDSSAALGEALYGGLGIGFRPRSEVERGVEDGRLAWVLPGYHTLAGTLVALMTAGSHRLPRVRLVADRLGAWVEAIADTAWRGA